MPASPTVEIIHLTIGDLRPDPANPRRISDEELESLTRSIREFGLIDPIIARREDKVVIGGHQRLLAARKLGMKHVPVVLVGGGSILVGDSLNGATEVIRPPHAEVANAIGAAIAQVGGQVEKVYSLENMGREEALTSARSEAVEKAVAAGADPASVEVVEVEEVPLTYIPSNAIRVRVKAVGDLAGMEV